MGTNKVQKKSKGVKTVEQAGKKSGKGKKYSNVPPPKPVEEESDSEESSEDEVEVPVKKGAKTAPKKAVKSQESDDDSSEEESSEEEEVAKPAPKAKKAPVKAAPAEESSDEDDSSEEEEEEKPKPKAKAAAKKPAPKKVVAEEESSDDDSDEDESEEEMETKPTKAAKAKAAPAKKEESSGEEEDSDDEDDSEEEEAMEVKQTKAAVKRKKTEESSEEEDSDEDSEEEDAPPAKKVKTPAGAKKPKANGDSTPAPATGGDDMISIFIANVDPSTTEEQIQAFFEENDVACSNARMVKSRKFAYVDVATEEEFNKAIELSESELNGSNIRLERGRKMDKTPQRGGQSNERAPPRGRSDGSDERTLFAKGLSYSTSNETLIETFGASDARIPMNEEGRPKGFAFIEFATEEAAEEALKNHQGVEIDGWSLMLDYCGSKRKNFASPGGRGGGGRGGGERGGGRGGGFGSFGGGDTSNSKTLFVKGIGHGATEESIASSLGATSVRIPRDRVTNEMKGFAYADFEDRSGAQSAIDSYQGNDGMFLDFARERTSSPGGRGGFGGRGGGRGFGGGRGGGGRGFGGRGGGGRGFGGRGGGGRGGFGGGRGRGGFEKKDGIKAFQGKKKTFGDD